MFEKIVKNVEELNAVALHLRLEGNMEELRQLAKKWQISKRDAEDFIAGKRYRLAEIKIEDRDYSTPEEKLRMEMLALKDQYFADIIAGYVIKRCRESGFGKNILFKHKSLQKCLDYVVEKAYQTALEQAKKNGQEGISQNTGLAIEQTQVFQWAEEYYTRDDQAEEAKKEAERKKKIQEEWEKEGQQKKTSIKRPNKTAAGTENRKAEDDTERNSKAEKKPSDGQMSMFDLLANAP